jgi:hypothetical protein
VQLMLQSGRLGIAAGLPLAGVLRDEILNFKTKTNPRDGKDEYTSWREGVHDDMVFATAIALWYASRFSPDGRRLVIPDAEEKAPHYDPYRFGLDE